MEYNNPIISVIVPVYNTSKYLNQCLTSLVEQSYRNLQIIIVDDGSTDNSPVMCDEWAQRDSRIQVIHKKNAGLGLARNTGLDQTKGQYVMFIDSDDYADLTMIEALYKALNANNSDTCIGGYKRAKDNGKTIETVTYSDCTFVGEDVYTKFFFRMLGSSPDKHDSIRMSVWNALYSLEIIKQNNIVFPSERELLSEDIVFDAEYYKHSKSASVIGESLYYYRINTASLSHSYKATMLDTSSKLYRYLRNSLLVSNSKEEGIYRIQKQYFVNIRSCVKQERKENTQSNRRERLQHIRKICNNNDVQDAINSYPISQLGIKQRLFLRLIQKKYTRVLDFLNEMGII